MKTSNKILLGTLLLILVIISAIHAAIYAKYKSNDFVTMKHLHEERYDLYPLNNVQSVSLSGLRNVTIIASDSARFEVEKTGEKALQHEFANGVLTITGAVKTEDNKKDAKLVESWSWRSVIIYLPGDFKLSTSDCEIRLEGSADSTKAPSISGDMMHTDLKIGVVGVDNHVSNNYFNKILFTKYNSGTLEISEVAAIKAMTVDMNSSGFEDNNASFGSIDIKTDSSSTIKLSGKNIMRAKLTLK